MEGLRTTTLAPNDLVSPSTSMAMAPLPGLSPGMAHTCCRLRQANGDRLTDAQIFRLLWQGLDAEHKSRALLLAVDDGRRELGLHRDEAHARHQIARAAVAAHH